MLRLSSGKEELEVNCWKCTILNPYELNAFSYRAILVVTRKGQQKNLITPLLKMIFQKKSVEYKPIE